MSSERLKLQTSNFVHGFTTRSTNYPLILHPVKCLRND